MRYLYVPIRYRCFGKKLPYHEGLGRVRALLSLKQLNEGFVRVFVLKAVRYGTPQARLSLKEAQALSYWF